MLPSDSGGVWLSFCFLLSADSKYVARIDRSKRARSTGAQQLSAPQLWLKCWVLPPRAGRGGGRSSPPAAWGGGAVSHPPAPACRPRPDYNNTEATSASRKKKRTGPRTHTAYNRLVSRARARGARTARIPARNRRVLRRAERRVSRRAERRVSRRAERRVSRRAERRVS